MTVINIPPMEYLEQEPYHHQFLDFNQYQPQIQLTTKTTLPPKPQPKSVPLSSNPPSIILHNNNAHNKNNKNTDNSIYRFNDNIPDSPSLNESNKHQHQKPKITPITLDLTVNSNDKSEDDVDMLRHQKSRNPSPRHTNNSLKIKIKKPKETDPEPMKKMRHYILRLYSIHS